MLFSGRTRSCAHDGCTATACYDSMARSRTTPICSDQSDISNNFGESCGIENQRLTATIENNPQQNMYAMHTTQTSTIRPSYDHYTHSVSSSQSNHNENRDINQSHPKLQRQMSVNPNACDPRIQRVQNANRMNRMNHHADQQHLVPHRLLSGSLSGPRSQNISNNWDVHQVRKIDYHSP